MMASSPRANLMFPEPVLRSSVNRMKVELDKKSLFALASDTRLEILKSLQPMRRTVSQLAETLDIDKAAVHRHLKKMEEGGLVQRYEDHGFVYYGLSWKARDLISPGENTRIIIMLSCSWILIGMVAFFTAALIISSGSPTSYGQPKQTGSELRQIGRVVSEWLAPTVIALAASVFGALVLVIASVRKTRRPRQSDPGKAENISVVRPEPDD